MASSHDHPYQRRHDCDGQQDEPGVSRRHVEQFQRARKEHEPQCAAYKTPGAQAGNCAPTHTPGMLPTSSEVVSPSCKSPNMMCPSAADATNGTA